MLQDSELRVREITFRNTMWIPDWKKLIQKTIDNLAFHHPAVMQHASLNSTIALDKVLTTGVVVRHLHYAPWLLAHCLLQQNPTKTSSPCNMRGQFLEHSRVPALLAELKSCSISRNLLRGKSIHESAIESGDDSDIWVSNSLINMYAKCGSLLDAHKVFDGMKTRTVVSWNALILGYADNGHGETALDLFVRMYYEDFAPDDRTFVVSLKACTLESAKEKYKFRSRQRGKAMNLLASTWGYDSDIYVQSVLVDMYAKCGCMDDAHRIFDTMQDRNEVSWNSLMMGYAENGEGEMSLKLFSRMRLEGCNPQERNYVAALKACTDLAMTSEDLIHRECGKAVHLLASSTGCDSYSYVENTLVEMYAKFGNMKDARRVFETIVQKNVVSWTALVFGYADTGEAEIALEMFFRMGREGCKPDYTSFVAALKACAELPAKDNDKGRAVHLLASCSGCDTELFVGNTMIDMYAKWGRTEDARKVFDSMCFRDVVSWTALILGYAVHGEAEMTLSMFSVMEKEGSVPDGRTFVAAVKACTDIAAVKSNETSKGEALHLLASAKGCDSNIYVQSSLVDMYAKFGWMQEARTVFDSMQCRDLVCWNALMQGYADNGEGKLVLKLFSHMKREGYEPDAFTFSAVLKACSTLGALDSGKAVHAEIFDHDLDTNLLATYLVDFYSKCGSLADARQVFEQLLNSHATTDLVIWNALMAGFGRQGDTKSLFDIFERMQNTHLQPNGVTLSILLTACSHAGLVNEGKNYFDTISTMYGIRPDVQHHTCLIDMLGRANKFEEAMFLLRRMYCNPTDITWTSVLGACDKWKNVELGRLAFECLMRSGNKDAGTCVVMSNVYRSSHTLNSAPT